jgi:hypothetical protein
MKEFGVNAVLGGLAGSRLTQPDFVTTLLKPSVGAIRFKSRRLRQGHISWDGAPSFDRLVHPMSWGVMRGFSSGRSARLPAEALFALLACSLLAPTKVLAGCASNAPHWSAEDRPQGFVDPLMVAGREQPPHESTPPTDPDRPRHCSGPSCSGRSTPPAVPVMSEARYFEPWACLGRTVTLPEPDRRLAATSSSGLHPVVVPASVFHPPRSITLPSDI